MAKLQMLMHDLFDALLADLQSTTSHISSYQTNKKTTTTTHTTTTTNYPTAPIRGGGGGGGGYRNARDSRDESPPPPLPPPPSQDVINSLKADLANQPIYEQQTVRASPQATRGGGGSKPSAPSPQPYRQQVTLGKHPQPPPPSSGRNMSALSSNLSELDSLLQDLSSAQFMAEVDRRNAANISGSSPMPPPTAPKPGQETRSVDSLLTDLEDFLPPNRQPEPEINHYEHVTPRQAPAPVQVSYPAGGGRHPASSATRELDDLMASLSEFKGNNPPHVGEPPYAQPQKVIARPNNAYDGVDGAPVRMHQASQGMMGDNGENLEAMLGNLNTDMNKQGVSTVPKGHCAACAKPIVGQVITGLGKIWHPEHFTCVHCREELGTQNFFERDGQPYCERDYHNLFSPRCAQCKGPILDKCVTALDQTWHPEHFICAQCGRPFGEDGFHEKDGVAYCREDYFEMFAPKCGGCSRPIMDNYISALNKQWHPECFICTECHIPFGGGSFYDHNGMPYCETHYHAKRGSLCSGCHKPITGRCITAMYKKFHPEHFVCAFCLKQLNKGTFKEQNEKPYCHPCFVKLFG